MATERQNFEAVIKLAEKLNKQMVKLGESATKAFKNIGEGKTLKDIKEAEKAIDDLTESTKMLQENRKTSQKVQKELTKEEQKLVNQRKKLSTLNRQTAKDLAIVNEAIRKQNANLRNEAKRRTEAKDSLNQYRAQLIAVRIRYDSLNKSERENEKVGGRLLKLNNALDKKVKDLEKSTGRTGRNVGNYSDSIKNAAKESGLFSRQITILNQIQATLNALLNTNTTETTTNTVAKNSNKTATIGLSRAQKAFAVATNFGSKALRGFKIALASTGIGAIIIAIGGLISLFTSTQRGADKLGQATAGLGAAFEVLRDRLSGIGDGLSLLFSGEFEAGFAKIKESFEGIGDEIAEETKLAALLEEQLQRVIRLENDLIAVRAASRSEINALKIITADILKTTDERIAAATKAVEIEENLANASIKIQQKRLATVLGVNVETAKGLEKVNGVIERIREGSAEAIAGGGDVLAAIEKSAIRLEEVGLSKSLEEDRAQAIEAVAAIFGIEEESLKRSKKLRTQISSVLEQDARRRLTIESLRIQLIDDAEEKALANEILRFKREKIEAEKVGLDLNLILEISLKRRQEIRDRFAADRQKKLDAENEKRRLAQEARDKKALKDAEALANFEADIRVKNAEGIDDIENAQIEAAEQRAQFLLANEQLTADERLLIEKQLQDEILDIQKDADAQRLEDSKKNNQELLAQQKELTDATLTIIEQSTQARTNKRVEALDSELDALRGQQNKLEELAAKGDRNALASLDAAQKREAEIRKEKEKELQRQKLIEAGTAAFKILAAKTEAGDKNAFGSTLSELTQLQLFVSTLSQFWDGAENVGAALGAPQLSGKDGHIVRVDGGERVVKTADNKRMGGLSNDKLTDIAEMYNKGLLVEQLPQYEIKQQRFESNAELVAKYDEMLSVMKNLHKKMPTDSTSFDAFRSALVHTQKKGNNTHKKGYLFD